MASYKSWASLKAAIQRENNAAMQEVVDKSFMDAHENVDEFYNSPEGQYKRTGQLAESPEHEFYGGGNVAKGIIRLDTTFVYKPSGISTEEIYTLGENGGLLGNGGFWMKTEQDIQKNINECYGKRFYTK